MNDPHILAARPVLAAVLVACLSLAQPARAEATLESALGLSRDQAFTVIAIEKKYRPIFAAKRTQFHNESRVLRRAHVARDSAAIAKQEPVVAALEDQLHKIKAEESDEIRTVLTPAQRSKYEVVLKQRKEKYGV